MLTHAHTHSGVKNARQRLLGENSSAERWNPSTSRERATACTMCCYTACPHGVARQRAARWTGRAAGPRLAPVGRAAVGRETCALELQLPRRAATRRPHLSTPVSAAADSQHTAAESTLSGAATQLCQQHCSRASQHRGTRLAQQDCGTVPKLSRKGTELVPAVACVRPTASLWFAN